MSLIPRVPNILEADHLVNRDAVWPLHRTEAGRWFPKRPAPVSLAGNRLLAAWLVLIGRADAIRWTEQ